MQIRRFFLAKQYLEGKAGYVVLGSIISPSHGATVRERYRNNISEIIPSPHRLAVAQLMLQDSKWCSVDPWEITRRRPMDYLSFLQHCNEMMKQFFPRVDIKVIYLCKANMVPVISPLAIQKDSFACISVCRPTETEQLRNSLTAKWSGLIHVVEDEAILDASLDTISSRRVRKELREGLSVKQFMGGLIDEYFRQHKIADKVHTVVDALIRIFWHEGLSLFYYLAFNLPLLSLILHP
jgi:nicotinic acid mononucleotide adenylyltransferase